MRTIWEIITEYISRSFKLLNLNIAFKLSDSDIEFTKIITKYFCLCFFSTEGRAVVCLTTIALFHKNSSFRLCPTIKVLINSKLGSLISQPQK